MTLAERARQIADDVLFPAALDVDGADRVPPAHLDMLAAEGLYGAAAEPDLDLAGLGAIVEALASGDLATTFVWIQHLTPVFALLGAESALAAEWLPALVAGERRGGIAIAGIRPPKDYLRVRRADGDFMLDGTAPWVTGWGMIDLVYVAARDSDDVVHFLLMDAVDAPTVRTQTLRIETQRLVAVQASNTVNVTFDGHVIPSDRLVSTVPMADWQAGDSGGSTLNGFLALGVASRCIRLLRDGRGDHDADLLATELDTCRAALVGAASDDADAGLTSDARAAASELAWRAAATLTAWQGARAVLASNHAQRLVREAAFTLVFGSRPVIRDALLSRLQPSR
ncbi:MAG TPA: acyl-CoA dehydrogenase family protein [Micromonosporaceae bacterium]